jgi:hypothetical protein
MLNGKFLTSILDYTTINRRINKLDIPINTAKDVSKDEYIVIAIDSTGISYQQRTMD